MRYLFCLLVTIILIIPLHSQEIYNCKSKPKLATTDNGIYDQVYFTLFVKKVSENTYKIGVEVKVNGEIESLKESGYAELILHQSDKETTSWNWKDWSEKEFFFPELSMGIYSGGFKDIKLSPNDQVTARIALEGKKGTYAAHFSLEFLKECSGILE